MFSVGIGITVHVCHWKITCHSYSEIGQLILFLTAKYMQKFFGYYFKCSNTNIFLVYFVMMASLTC